MDKKPTQLLDCPEAILRLVSEQLLDNLTDLCSFGLVCSYFRSISLPILLSNVDLSCHNICQLSPVDPRYPIYSDDSDDIRDLNHVTRQRAFLRLISHRPELASYVKSFSWTLIWIDFKEFEITKIDLQLWNVFGQLTNVRRLDLASLHNIVDVPFIRKNPPRLFPGVTHLRLVGWMHRGLTDAIISSVDPTALRSLKLDYLQDEGAYPNGMPISWDDSTEYAHNAYNTRRIGFTGLITDELYERQRTGRAWTFPGPMWTVPRMLACRKCTALEHLQLKIAPFSEYVDLRNYFTCFEEISRFLATVTGTLKSLNIVFGESKMIYYQDGTGPVGFGAFSRRRLWNITVAAEFMRSLLPLLTNAGFSSLTSVRIQGLYILNTVMRFESQLTHSDDIEELSRNCPLAPWNVVIGESHEDEHIPFLGYDYTPDEEIAAEFQQLLGLGQS